MITAITGASGYLGINLARELIDAGHLVRALDRSRSPVLPPEVDFQEIDIFDASALGRALEGVEVLFHLVAVITLKQEDPLAWKVNTDGVRVVAETALATGVRRMVHVSSIASFDQFAWREPIVEGATRATAPSLSAYARSKYAGEVELLKVVEQGLEGVICYPTGVYGPDDHTIRMSRINESLLGAARGKTPVMVEGGFDLVDVRDVTQGLLLAAERGRSGESYLLGGEFIDMIDVFRHAASLVGRRGPLFALPIGPLKAIAPVIEWVLKHLGIEADYLSRVTLTTIETSPHVDHAKATSELGYAPRPLEVTMRDLLSFFSQNGLLPKSSPLVDRAESATADASAEKQ